MSAATRSSNRIAGRRAPPVKQDSPPPPPPPPPPGGSGGRVNQGDRAIFIEKLYAWMNIYFGLFQNIQGRQNAGLLRMPSLPNLWMRLNAYFTARSVIDMYRPSLTPQEGRADTRGPSLAGTGSQRSNQHERMALADWTRQMTADMPIGVASLQIQPPAGARDFHPRITEQMLTTYTDFHSTLNLARELDWTTAPQELQDFINTNADEVLALPAPPQPGDEPRWYEDMSTFRSAELNEATKEYEPTGPWRSDHPRNFPGNRWHIGMGDVKQRAYQNAAVVPPIGYGRNPRFLLDQDRYDQAAQDVPADTLPPRDDLDWIIQGEIVGDLELEKKVRAAEPPAPPRREF